MDSSDTVAEPRRVSDRLASLSAPLRRAALVGSFAVVVYIAFIGIAAIEEVDARDQVLAQLTARELEVSRAAAEAGTVSEEDRAMVAKLRGLRQRLSTLILTGASVGGTLRDIQCDLVRIYDAKRQCFKRKDSTFAKIVLKTFGEHGASGAILGVLIVTAAFGGGLIRLSLPGDELHRDEVHHPALLLLRSLGGGIVCYVAIDGGSLASSPAGLSISGNSAASASLLGFLAGMFSDRVFSLLSALVDAAVEKVRPKRPART